AVETRAAELGRSKHSSFLSSEEIRNDDGRPLDRVSRVDFANPAADSDMVVCRIDRCATAPRSPCGLDCLKQSSCQRGSCAKPARCRGKLDGFKPSSFGCG